MRDFGHGHGGGRRRRGDIRTAVLAALEESPAHGYEIIQRFEEKTAGAWRPSAGSIYPTLQLLEDEGLITAEEVEGKRVFSLTEAGKAAAADRKEGLPWEQMGPGDEDVANLRKAGMGLIQAAWQAGQTATPEQQGRIADILNEARKRIYAILAEDA